MPGESASRSWLSVLGWACYLACSWTWCIGMYLPVILIRDYGPWSFVVFAVPNVVGAAAMGWVLRRPGASETLVAKHGALLTFFSLVTVAFQLFFLAQLCVAGQQGPGVGWVELIGPILAFVVCVITVVPWGGYERRGIREPIVRPLLLPNGAIAIWLTSAAVAVYMLLTDHLHFPPRVPVPAGGASGSDPLPLLSLSPAIVFGFLLCPYLDATFHLARQRSRGAVGTTSFVVGFGVFFAAMILFTYFYAYLALPESSIGRSLGRPDVAYQALAVHIAVQIFFTSLAHMFARAVPEDRAAWANIPPNLGKVVVIVGSFGVILALVLAPCDVFFWSYHGLSPSELVYRLFMSFYGLIFPAYVWLCMLPFRSPLTLGEGRGEGPGGSPAQTDQKHDEHGKDRREDPHSALSQRERGGARFGASPRAIAVWGITCVIAAPFYWMGFIERVEWWLVPGLAIVLLAKLFIPPSERGSSLPPPEPRNAPVPVHSGPPGLSAAAEPER